MSTRTEHEEASSENVVAQKAEGEETHRKKLHRDILIFAALLATVPFLVIGISDDRDKASDSISAIAELATSNYEVQSVTSIKDTSYIGYDMTVTVDNKTYECRGITKWKLKAKKMLGCDDTTIYAKP